MRRIIAPLTALLVVSLAPLFPSICNSDTYCPYSFIGQWNGLYYYNVVKCLPLPQAGGWLSDSVAHQCTNPVNCNMCADSIQRGTGTNAAKLSRHGEISEGWEVVKRHGMQLTAYVPKWNTATPGTNKDPSTMAIQLPGTFCNNGTTTIELDKVLQITAKDGDRYFRVLKIKWDGYKGAGTSIGNETWIGQELQDKPDAIDITGKFKGNGKDQDDELLHHWLTDMATGTDFYVISNGRMKKP